MKVKKSVFEFLETLSFREFIKDTLVKLIPGLIVGLIIVYIWLGREYFLSLFTRPSGFYVYVFVYIGFGSLMWLIAKRRKG